jgi:ferredoxin
MRYLSIKKEEWDKALERLLASYTIFATMTNEFGLDYEIVSPSNIRRISYNKPKPATSLKTFFLPVRENVSSETYPGKQRIILGAPACDVKGLNILDEIYLDRNFNDMFFRERRENTLLISSDCFGIQKHCHCTSYDIKPYMTDDADLTMTLLDNIMVLGVISSRGEDFISQLTMLEPLVNGHFKDEIEKARSVTESLLSESNKGLPGYSQTGILVKNSGEAIWKKYSSTCVSCGACTTICPTCSCFLLIDKPGFAKVKQLDVCQYPGFEKVAAGEDPLFELPRRFRNRYMCKYVWKPEKFKFTACTGCGRCIEACIGKINKNELFMELTTA